MGEIWGGVSSRALVGRHDSVFRDYAARRVHRRGRQGRRGPPPTPMAEIWPRYGRDMAEVWPRDGRDTFPAAARHISAPSRLPLGSLSTVSRGSSEQSRSNLGAISEQSRSNLGRFRRFPRQLGAGAAHHPQARAAVVAAEEEGEEAAALGAGGHGVVPLPAAAVVGGWRRVERRMRLRQGEVRCSHTHEVVGQGPG